MGRIKTSVVHSIERVDSLPPTPLPFLPGPPGDLGNPIQQQTHGFFALPAELRQQILVEAFGKRTIHIDLRLRASQRSDKVPGKSKQRHGGYPPLMDDGQTSTTQKQQPDSRSWQWYSCICHRVAPPGETSLWVQEPFWDSCLQGVAACCEAWSGDFPGRCMVGAMGFLLSCKQAYIDAIDILYSTNEMFMESPELIDNVLRQSLPGSNRLIGPGVHWITSITLKWTFALFGPESDPREKNERLRFDEGIRLLPRTFPRLRKLYIAFGDGLYGRNTSPQSVIDEIHEVLLQPLVALTDNLQLGECTVALPSNVFDTIRAEAPVTPQNNAKLSADEGIWSLKIRYPWGSDNRNPTSQSGFWIKYGGESSLQFRPDGTSFSLSDLAECPPSTGLLPQLF